MQTDKLIRGNIYTFVDDDGQARKCMFERTVTLPNHSCGFRFKVESDLTRGYCRNLTKDEVINKIFRAPHVPI